MVKVLEDRYKLRIYAGYEPEFRIFRKEGFEESTRNKPGSQADTIIPPTPWTSGSDMLRYGHLSAYEFFVMDLDQYLQAAGIDIIEYLNENGSGEIETPLVPKFGIAAADTYFIFKHAVREIAKKHDMRVSFMTKPLVGELSTGCHFNHSLWDIESGKNVLFDSSASDNLSNLAHNWLGGLFEHMPALTALCSPTVNCYRRLHAGWAPGHMDWELDNRFVTVRLKNVGEDGTYLENRLSSSASCPYHVMAATLAAGMDGIERRLEPPSRGAYNPAKGAPIMKELPKTLKEAIDALKKDTILVDRLGNQFVDWFIRAKEFGDLKTLGQIDIKEESEEFLAQERYEYLEFI
ncbi:glutamate--ammonia ligase, catalytic domain protein [Opisthorchis viverrini]|uniref:Lengsin n=1 Tax=Opisthorchis viverrini TaxID=6198 RepID=A0A1S8X2S4_OPIVI|nr:glutamate--ammonia ligase, catalytic domain protein [Opisthorchis viverrini]